MGKPFPRRWSKSSVLAPIFAFATLLPVRGLPGRESSLWDQELWGPAFAPAWSVRAYVNEAFAIHGRDFGRCLADRERGLVFCGAKNGKVLALTISDGFVLWTFEARGAIRGQPLIVDDDLVFGSADGCVYRVRLEDGKNTWPKPFCTDGAVYSDIAKSGELLFFSVTLNKVYGIDSKTGRFRWEYHRERPEDMSIEGLSSPVVEKGRLYVGFSDGTIVSLSLEDGTVFWTQTLSDRRAKARDVDTTPVIKDGVLYAASFAEGPVALRVEDGHVLWRASWLGATKPLIVGDTLIFGTAEGEIVGLRRGDGSTVFVTALGGKGAVYPLALARGFVIAPGDRGLYLLDSKNGAPLGLLAVPNGVFAEPEVLDERLFFVGSGGTVMAVDIRFR